MVTLADIWKWLNISAEKYKKMKIIELKQNIIKLLRKAVSDLPSDFDFELDIPPDPKMGHLFIASFKAAQYLHQSPEKVAADIVAKLKDSKIGPLSRVENTGPYVNFFLDQNIWFKSVLEEILKQKQDFGQLDLGQGKKILIEYSAPNTNKPQHLGHLRNDFLGWSLSNLLSFAGFKVNKVNLINDRGVHICKSMLAYQKWGQDQTPESEKIKGDHLVGKYYVLFEEKVKQNPALIDQARDLLKKWEQGDPATLALWQKMNQWAIKGLEKTYQKIGIDFDHVYYESDIYNSGKKIILAALKKGLCYQREDGAVEIDLTKDGLDKKVLIRSDGTSVYVTQDIGLAKLKQKQFKPDRSIYVVGSEQDYHFKVLFRVLEIFGFKWAKTCYHLSYGLISLPEGKMKSREGTVVEADDIISEMEQLAKSEILNRNSSLSPVEVSRRAEIIALGALKFFLLKFTPVQNIHFRPKESISFEGDTGPYVQYTYARIQSILRKNNQALKKINYRVLGQVEEIELLKLLFMYPEIIRKSVDHYNPAYLANYCLKLSQKFNEFYHQHRVLQAKSDLKNARLVLISGVGQVIKNSLNLLGIRILEEM